MSNAGGNIAVIPAKCPKWSIIQNVSHLLVAPHDCQILVSLMSASTSCGHAFPLAYRRCVPRPDVSRRSTAALYSITRGRAAAAEPRRLASEGFAQRKLWNVG